MGLQAEGEAIEKVDLGPTRTRRDILNYVNLSALFPFDLPPSFINQKLPMRSAPHLQFQGKGYQTTTRQRKRHRRKKGSKQMKGIYTACSGVSGVYWSRATPQLSHYLPLFIQCLSLILHQREWQHLWASLLISNFLFWDWGEGLSEWT